MTILTPGLLAQIRSRAADYDRRNEFFTEDLAALRAAGYLHPRSLAETVRDQRLLAAHAPPTALGLAMHHIWIGVARALSARGDNTLDWLLADAAAGELFAFGSSEAGNDLVLSDSLTVAAPQPGGGYAFTGTKIFTSLAPVWTRLGVHGRDGDTLVYGFISRENGVEAEGVTTLPDWNTLGMRATQSRSTMLEGAIVAPDRIVRRVPVGPSDDPFIFAIFANFEVIVSAVYAGIADRALELAVEAAHSRTSLRHGGRSYASDPDIRWQIADAAIALDALTPQFESIVRDLDAQVDRGDEWFRHLVGLKTRTVDTARLVVDHAIRVSGGRSFAEGNELSRLYRDVLAGLFQPSDPESAHSVVAENLLGPAD